MSKFFYNKVNISYNIVNRHLSLVIFKMYYTNGYVDY